MHETSAWTWCTRRTWRDRVEREVGGGTGMGNACGPMAVSFQCMTKSTTIKKIIIKWKKKKKCNDKHQEKKKKQKPLEIGLRTYNKET